MYLFGASGHAKVIVDILKAQDIEVLGFFDDDESIKALDGVTIVGVTEDHDEAHNPCIISIGNNVIRKKVVERLVAARYCSAIHPRAVVASSSYIHQGTAVMAGAVVNPAVRIGEHCIINTSASVDHDCKIENFVHIAPNATLCGGVQVGEGTLVGSGATVIPNITVGKWVTIGAGTVVVSDVPDHAVVVGNPGKVVKIQVPQ